MRYIGYGKLPDASSNDCRLDYNTREQSKTPRIVSVGTRPLLAFGELLWGETRSGEVTLLGVLFSLRCVDIGRREVES